MATQSPIKAVRRRRERRSARRCVTYRIGPKKIQAAKSKTTRGWNRSSQGYLSSHTACSRSNAARAAPRSAALHAPEVECIGKASRTSPTNSASRSASPPPSNAARAASSPTIERDHGVFVFSGPQWQVHQQEAPARSLGAPLCSRAMGRRGITAGAVYIDLFDDYIELA
jgi:hypothetical protein